MKGWRQRTARLRDLQRVEMLVAARRIWASVGVLVGGVVSVEA